MLRGPFRSEAAFKIGVRREAVRFKVRDLVTWTDSAAFPLLPTEESGVVFSQLRRATRLDLDDGSSWRAKPYAELHSTHEKPLMKFGGIRPAGFWPVLKGESFDIWDPDAGVSYAWANPEKVLPFLQRKRLTSTRLGDKSGHAGFPPSVLAGSDTLPCLFARVVFRKVTRSTDTRTVRAALVPPRAFLTEAALYFLWPRGNELDQAFLLGVLCSIPLDWYARRFVEINLNYHVINPFPVPRVSRDSALWQRAVYLAGRLACPDKRFRKWAEAVGVEYGPLPGDEREDMIHELDAVVAHLYGLSESQLVHIFETFHEGWDYAERLKNTLLHFRQGS